MQNVPLAQVGSLPPHSTQILFAGSFFMSFHNASAFCISLLTLFLCLGLIKTAHHHLFSSGENKNKSVAKMILFLKVTLDRRITTANFAASNFLDKEDITILNITWNLLPEVIVRNKLKSSCFILLEFDSNSDYNIDEEEN